MNKNELKMKDVIEVGDDVMIQLNCYTPTYIKSKFLKNGEDVRKVDIHKHTFGKNNLKCDSNGRWNKKIISGLVIRSEGDKYLIGFDECNDWDNYDGQGNPPKFLEPHPYYPSFKRITNDEWDICEYGCWVDREDFYLIGGFEHTDRLMTESKKEINKLKLEISNKEQWVKDLKDDWKKLENEFGGIVIPSICYP